MRGKRRRLAASVLPTLLLRRLAPLLLTLLTVSPGHSLAADKALDISYLIVEGASAPLQIPEQTGVTGRGIITDLIAQIAGEKIPLRHRSLPFKRVLDYMTDSSVEQHWLSYGSAAWTGPQSEHLARTTIIRVRHQFLTRTGTQYQSIEDFFGERVILIYGFDYPGLQPYLDSGQLQATYVKDHQGAIRSLLNNRGIAFADMSIRHDYHLKAMQLDDKLLQRHDIADIIPDYDITLCFSENFPLVQRQYIESELSTLKTSGKLQQILARYR